MQRAENPGQTNTRHHPTIDVECRHGIQPLVRSSRAVDVALRFGLSLEPRTVTVVEPTRIPLSPGSIVAIVGPSGSGKSSVLRALRDRLDRVYIDVSAILFNPCSCVLDEIAPTGTLSEALEILSACGLAEARLWLRRFDELSEGERFRARLAKAAAMSIRMYRPAPILCDEFCSALHHRAARAVAFGVRKLAWRYGLCVVTAIHDDDVFPDLQPDIVIRLSGAGHRTMEQRASRRRPFSLRARLRIDHGRRQDYEPFAAMHYRDTAELGFVDRVFVLRGPADAGSSGSDLLGVIVYAHGPLELALRNEATGGRFVRRPDRLNREVRIIRRLVIHPDVRGCGLGRWLVRRTLPLVGTRYVECLAEMGEINPVFEKAGMSRIGRCPLPARSATVLTELRKLGADPLSPDFAIRACRDLQVRELIRRFVTMWYESTTGGGRGRTLRQTPVLLARLFRGIIAQRPVYYLWERKKAPFPEQP